MAGVNKVIILGRLGADPELRMTQGGQAVCTMSLATSESWIKDGNKEERTEWHRVVLWGKQAELAAKYLKKGRNVYIEGRLQTRSWEDQQGQKRYSTEIVGNTITFVDSNQRDAGGGYEPAEASYGAGGGQNDYHAQGPRSSQPTPGSDLKNMSLDDDVPF